MKNERNLRTVALKAFTLIELLVVIAIMGILAALIIPAMGAIKVKAMIARTQAELTHIEAAIEAYKDKNGFYPPDNPGNPLINQLYFELSGTKFDGTTYSTLDGSVQIPVASLNAAFPGGKVTGFMNCSKGGDDSSSVARPYLLGLRPNQVGQLASGPKILVVSLGWPDNRTADAPIPGTLLNPWRYVSTNPTNRPGAFDLWADIIIRGQTNRIGNWNKQPQLAR